ncbi:MAG: hypothetical protein RJQ21_08315 [Rhodospirillales bacterium]
MSINVERYRIIFGKMNEIFDVHSNKRELSKKEYIKILHDYCSMLSALTDQKGLDLLLETVAEKVRDEEVYKQAREILQKSESLAEFLVLEADLLESVGVSPAFANYLADKQAVIKGLTLGDLDDLAAARGWVDELRNIAKVTCEAVDETNGTARWLKIKKYSTFAGGWMIVVANGSGGLLGTLAGAPKLSIPAAIVSIAGGRTMIKLSDAM